MRVRGALNLDGGHGAFLLFRFSKMSSVYREYYDFYFWLYMPKSRVPESLAAPRVHLTGNWLPPEQGRCSTRKKRHTGGLSLEWSTRFCRECQSISRCASSSRSSGGALHERFRLRRKIKINRQSHDGTWSVVAAHYLHTFVVRILTADDRYDETLEIINESLKVFLRHQLFWLLRKALRLAQQIHAPDSAVSEGTSL